MTNFVLEDWVGTLPYKQQTALLCSLRGCDGTPKLDPSKYLVRHLRAVVVKHAAANNPFLIDTPSTLDEIARQVARGIEAYPVHFMIHVIHASEIVAYKHPVDETRAAWKYVYEKLVHALHLLPETPEGLELRLCKTEAG